MATPSSSTTLLSLPKEIRLIIYDILFKPLIARPKHFDTYVLPYEWPMNDFCAYTDLTLACKTLRDETKVHFEYHYLPKLMVYFDNLPQIYDFCCTVNMLPEQYQNVSICLYTAAPVLSSPLIVGEDQYKEAIECYGARAEVNSHVRAFMAAQDGIPDSCAKAYPSPFLEIYYWDEGYESQMHDKWWAALGLKNFGDVVQQKVRGSKLIDVLRVPMSKPGRGMNVHQVCGYQKSSYATLVGKPNKFYPQTMWIDPYARDELMMVREAWRGMKQRFAEKGTMFTPQVQHQAFEDIKLPLLDARSDGRSYYGEA